MEVEIIQACVTQQETVYVINNLPPNSAPLKLHCASKDDDLGYHTLSTNQDYHWSFCDDVIPKTLYFCHLWWGSKNQAFDAYKQTWVRPGSNQHYWVAKSDGIYFSEQNTPS